MNASPIIKKLLMALQSRDILIAYNTSQFYSDEKQKMITMYTLTHLEKNEETGIYKKEKMITTANMVHILYYLRDMWYELNDMEIPYDENWAAAKRMYESKSAKVE